jgi:orotidine-5'-phosphate decarboxylase
MKLRERWLEICRRKNTVLCAGVDPAVYEMGRGERGLSEGVSKREWALAYIEAAAPFCAAVKPNLQYWKDTGDPETAADIYELAKELGLIVIEDSKIADIGSTNEAGIYYTSRRAHAVTFSPFAGNGMEACEQAHAYGIGIIPMCLMSNPEYRSEKEKLVPVGNERFKENDILSAAGSEYVKQYIYLAAAASEWGADGVVIGAPSKQNHIQEEEIKTAASYLRDEMLVLCPGIGAQGGEAQTLFRVFGKERVIINMGRSLMFPAGSRTTPEDQREAAKQRAAALNQVREGN